MQASEIIQPLAISQPVAISGIKNTIPENATGSNLASIQEGFPQKTMISPQDGGEPPYGQDFNGLFYLSTDQRVYTQNGGIITFNQDVSDAIGGYPQGAILDYYVSSTQSFSKVVSLIDNNTNNFVTTPSYIDGVNWELLNFGGANIDLSNLSPTGQAILNSKLDQTQITNCILEAPNGVATVIDNVITIHQGLKLLFSNGRNSDNTLKNLEYTLQSDLVRDYKVTGLLPADTRGVLYFWIKTDNLNSKSMTAMQESGVGQGSTVPANYSGVFYNTKENTIKFYTRGSLTPGYETAIYIPVANYVVDSKQNISLTPYQTLKVMDYNDFYNLQNNSANTSLTNLTNGLANVICTTAPTTTSTASNAQPAVVIQNYVNGTSGYRVYSDGYCEQWGQVTNTQQPTTVTLLKQMRDTNYNIMISPNGDTNSGANQMYIRILNITINSFAPCVYGIDAHASLCFWKVSGYIK